MQAVNNQTAMNFNPEAVFQEKLRNNLIDFECPYAIKSKFLSSLHYASTITLGISGEEYKELLEKLTSSSTLSCYQYAICSNNLEMRTPSDLSLDLNQYADLMVEVGVYSAKWKEQTSLFQEEVMQEMNALMNKEKLPKD